MSHYWEKRAQKDVPKTNGVAAGLILFIFLIQGVDQSKFDRGPDLACGPDFGHA